MRFTGRDYRSPVTSVRVVGSAVCVRADDDRDDSLWCELHLTRNDLLELLRQVDAADDRDELDDDDMTPLASELEGTPGAILPTEGD